MSKFVPQSMSRLRLIVLLMAIAGISLGVGISALVRPSSAITNGGSITTLGVPLTENFDTLAQTGTSNTWTDNTTIPGWYSTRTVYIGGTGSITNGGLYSFGVAGTNPVTDRALGSIGSSSTGTIYHAVRLTNNTGVAITSLAISYN